MAHGQDVANLGRIRGVTAATRWVLRPLLGRDRQLALARRSAHGADPGGRGRRSRSPTAASTSRRSRPARPTRPARELGWDGEGPAFLCVGSLIERKNVVRLAEAFASLGRGRLAFVGDGPLRAGARGAARVTLAGRIPQSEVPHWVAACDVLCQPSLIEPFGQATLEAMAMERTVVATSSRRPARVRHPGGRASWSIPQDPAALPARAGAGGEQAHRPTRPRARRPPSTT